MHTTKFRPPHGSITLSAWLKLRKAFTFYYWAINSGDSDLEDFNLNKSFNTLITETMPGAIVLFHFCKRHELETKQLLPLYLEWLYNQGWKAEAIK